MNLAFDFSVDKKNNTINVKREFDADIETVWEAWTNPEIIDLWWAPKPYKTNTKSMDFREGGRWLYNMTGPNNFIHWCLADYKQIIPLKSYSALDAFCDENGKINEEHPRSFWTNIFESKGETSIVNVAIKYESLEDLEKIIEMGFKEGFTMAMGNLDEYIQSNLK